MTKAKKEELTKKYIQSAKKSDWDSLALCIIEIEQAIPEEKDPKVLELLELKLKIFEAEKSSRVFDSFDMEYFLSKDMSIFDEDDYDFSDI
jgi:hypothetical protein